MKTFRTSILTLIALLIVPATCWALGGTEDVASLTSGVLRTQAFYNGEVPQSLQALRDEGVLFVSHPSASIDYRVKNSEEAVLKGGGETIKGETSSFTADIRAGSALVEGLRSRGAETTPSGVRESPEYCRKKTGLDPGRWRALGDAVSIIQQVRWAYKVYYLQTGHQGAPPEWSEVESFIRNQGFQIDASKAQSPGTGGRLTIGTSPDDTIYVREAEDFGPALRVTWTGLPEGTELAPECYASMYTSVLLEGRGFIF